MTSSVNTMVTIQTLKNSTVIGNRPPKSKNEPLTNCITEFTNILNSIQNQKSIAYICDDYNIDLLKIPENVNIKSLGFHSKISLPTWLGNCVIIKPLVCKKNLHTHITIANNSVFIIFKLK